MVWRVYARDETLRRVAEINDYQNLECTLRFNATGSYSLTVPAWRTVPGQTAQVLSELVDAAGLEIVRDGKTVLSGPVTDRERRWAPSENSLTVTGVDDMVWLARRLALPVPSGPPYNAQAYDVRTGPAETLLRAYVDVNAGPGAKPGRQVPGLVLAADQGRGVTVTGRARFQPVDELLRELALSGGDLGFRIAQVGTALEFQVYQPADKTKVAVFDRRLGNLREYTYRETAPTRNYMYVGGGGEGTLRTFVQGGVSSSIVAWGRIEGLEDDQSATDETGLRQTRDRVLAEDATSTGLALSPVDTDGLRYGRDYQLGDRVTAVVDGVPVVDVLREVRLSHTPDQGERVDPVVGTPGVEDPRRRLRIFDDVRAAKRRVSGLERR